MLARVANSHGPEGETVIRGAGRPGGAPDDETFPETALAANPNRTGWAAVPGYEILAELGRGSMGVVYKARHLRLNRLVALKVVLHGAHTWPEDLVRFLCEAEVLARCQHPHVVLIHDVGWHDGRPYLAMELVEGGTLAQKCAGVPQPPRPAAQLTESLARAVHHAHRRGIVHRDVKPSNVLLTEGGLAKLTDFGLAKRLDDGGGLTETGCLLGTPTYMAPEQALCGDVGPATDVYALGVLLYELLTGAPPFRADCLLRTLEQVVSEPPRHPGQVRAGVPRDLEAICLKCLQKAPGDRYASAEELAEDLRRFRKGLPVLARPPRPWRRLLAWARRRPGATGCGLGALLGAAVSIACTSAGVASATFVIAVAALAYAAWCLVRVRAVERQRDSFAV